MKLGNEMRDADPAARVAAGKAMNQRSQYGKLRRHQLGDEHAALEQAEHEVDVSAAVILRAILDVAEGYGQNTADLPSLARGAAVVVQLIDGAYRRHPELTTIADLRTFLAGSLPPKVAPR